MPGMKCGLLACVAMMALVGISTAPAEDAYSRSDVLAALAVSGAQLPDAKVSPLPPQVAAPAEKNPYLLALQKMAVAQGDPELIAALLRYQLAYLLPDNDLPARVMGVVFYEQPDTFVRVYNEFPAAARVILGPYLKFGFEKTVEGRNASSPQVKAARKKFDALQGSLMNARSRDDVR
ncbi:MAG: hypothetical protein B9S32_17580 [Verrucomicrobia bacterium Tous-C9LFEB]|nr:MAG: hypothetical protein B9S32_17580 [Verrucomicrobia bacterium Tous-C9LFEB]